ncbi:acyl-CoA dehydrogenase family protein, partial [Fischerella thermalis]
MNCDRQVSPKENHSVLEIAHSYLLNSVAVKANEIDSNPDALMHALQGLRDLGLLALRVPQNWGGKEISEETFSDFQELVARYSGALAFLQTQHQSAAAMLVASSNSVLKQEYLPRIGKGELLIGVGFSQLRRGGEPLTIAKLVPGGYQLDGIVPWVTGWGMFDDFIVAATLPDGRAVFGVVPFQDTYQNSTSKITFTSPAELAAMTSTNTVTANLNNYFLPQERVVSIKPGGWIHENDKNNILRATFLATGCAFAGLDIIESALQTKSLPAIAAALTALQQELNHCRTAIRQLQKNTHAQLSQKLQLRAWAIDLATRIAHAAVTVSSGAANYLHHPAQRVYREALVFTVTGQTSAVMEATLEKLSRRWGDRGENSDLSSQIQTITYSRVIHLSHVIDTNI